MKLKSMIQIKLAKTLVAALLIGSISNTGFTVQAEEAPQNEQNDVVEMASVSGNDSTAAEEKTAEEIQTTEIETLGTASAEVALLTDPTTAIATQKTYPTINTVILAGGIMAKWLGGQEASPKVWPNNYKPKNGDFSLFAGHKMTLDDAATFKYLSAYNTGVDAEGKLTGSNGANWQCVGFVALDVNVNKYSDCEPEDLLHYVYYSGDSEDTPYYEENCGKTLEDVKQYVNANNGVLYGEEVSESFMDQLLATGRSYKTQVTIATVWYVTTPTDTWTNYEGYDYKIPGVSAVDYYEYPAETVTFEQNENGAVFHYASEGVTIATTPELKQHWESGTGRVTYDAEITITIHSNAPDRVRINLSDAIGYLNGTVAGGNAAEPGDTLYYNIKLVNESNREYQYDPATAMIGTIPAAPKAGEEVTVLSRGFEGYEIGEVGRFCTLPRRILNAPLRDLGITTGKVTDAVVGEALLKKGYGSEGMKPEEVTQNCLAQYYLDWFNNTSREEGNKAYSFAELTAEELAILTNGTADTTVAESCSVVADALYYTTYHNVYTFDGEGLYDRMLKNGQEGSYADTLVSGLLRDGEAKITSNLNGELANNGYQMTRYGFGMQFELSREPEVTPPVTTSPEPTPSTTPEPTPSTTPAPTPTGTPDTTLTPTATPTVTPETPDDSDDSDTPEIPVTPSEPAAPVTPQVLGVRRQRVVSITDDPTPLADRAVLGASRRPKTGDDSNTWNLGFALSLTGLGAWLIIKKKQS